MAKEEEESSSSSQLILHDAVKSNNMELVREILKTKRIDPNLEDQNGVTALIEACIAGYVDIATVLMQEGGCAAQPSPPFRHTPLRGATVAGQYQMIPLLLEAGADPNALSDGNRTPLMGACFLRKTVQGNHNDISVKCVEALLKDTRTNPTIANDFGETALDLAKIRGYQESIKMVEQAVTDWQSRQS